MVIIGLDYHPGFQQIAFVDTETGELQERRLQHREEAEKFYRDLAARGMKAIRNEGGLPHPGAGARVFRDRQRTEGSEVLSAPHALNAEARRDRSAFLVKELNLKPPDTAAIARIPELVQPHERKN